MHSMRQVSLEQDMSTTPWIIRGLVTNWAYANYCCITVSHCYHFCVAYCSFLPFLTLICIGYEPYDQYAKYDQNSIVCDPDMPKSDITDITCYSSLACFSSVVGQWDAHMARTAGNHHHQAMLCYAMVIHPYSLCVSRIMVSTDTGYAQLVL